jgi:hypothetical protein
LTGIPGRLLKYTPGIIEKSKEREMAGHDNTNAIAAGMEQGILALLGSKSTAALTLLVPPSELVLICCSLIATLHAIPRGAAVAGRVSGIMAQVLSLSLTHLLEIRS